MVLFDKEVLFWLDKYVFYTLFPEVVRKGTGKAERRKMNSA